MFIPVSSQVCPITKSLKCGQIFSVQHAHGPDKSLGFSDQPVTDKMYTNIQGQWQREPMGNYPSQNTATFQMFFFIRCTSSSKCICSHILDLGAVSYLCIYFYLLLFLYVILESLKKAFCWNAGLLLCSSSIHTHLSLLFLLTFSMFFGFFCKTEPHIFVTVIWDWLALWAFPFVFHFPFQHPLMCVCWWSQPHMNHPSLFTFITRISNHSHDFSYPLFVGLNKEENTKHTWLCVRNILWSPNWRWQPWSSLFVKAAINILAHSLSSWPFRPVWSEFQ